MDRISDQHRSSAGGPTEGHTAQGQGLGRCVEQAVSLRRCCPRARLRHVQLARATRALLRCPGLLNEEQTIPKAGDGYRAVLLWSDPCLDLSLLALVWQCGQRTLIHDHHAACVVGLYQGAERETRYERTAPGADTVIPVGETILRVGSVVVVPPGEKDIHRVEAVAPWPTVAVPLHFYEVDVTRRPGGSSIRQRFQEATSDVGSRQFLRLP